MRVRLLLFAVLRDVVDRDMGAAGRELVLAEGTRANDVWKSLRESHARLAGYVQPPMIAINETYATPDTILRDGDELAFIPPVAGG